MGIRTWLGALGILALVAGGAGARGGVAARDSSGGAPASAGVAKPIAEAKATATSSASATTMVVPAPAHAGKMVDLKSGEDTIQAYLAVPKGGGSGAPAMVVIHEWWGLTDWVKSIADRFASQGYVAIAPDLYRGQVAADPELAHELMRGLPDTRAIRDVRAAAAYLAGRLDLAPKATGVIGFCMGGGISLRSSLDQGPFTATVVCYGSPETDPARLKTLRGPVLGIFGADDRGLGKDQTDPFEAGLKATGHLAAVKVYPGAGHAFLNDTRPSYVEAAAKQAWGEIDGFLAGALQRQKGKGAATKP